jgi:methylphosphotriester-DNA--protein-cysteine methyltransferase
VFRSVPMPSLAATVGLSPQYPRALARHQVGMPLAGMGAAAAMNQRAAEALRAGQSLADVAITARLADQAHLTRWMREMVGSRPRPCCRCCAITPGVRRRPRSSR